MLSRLLYFSVNSMHIQQKHILFTFLAMIVALPTFGQRFTKKEQALREARAINYFYGNSFTLSSGYVHGWMATDHFAERSFGRTGLYGNTRESFSFSFDWDYVGKNKAHGFQTGVSYAQFGGEKVFYADQGLGYGPQQRYDLTEQIHINELMVYGKYRYFIPLTYKSRLSLNAGVYISRVLGKYDSAKDWDMGPVVGLGYDWKHLSTSINYLPGVYGNIVEHSTTRVSGLMFNVGLHLWK